MRKRWITIFISLPLVFVIGLTTALFSYRTATQYQEWILEMQASVLEEDWASAQAQLEKLSLSWTHMLPAMQIWVDHEETDDISVLLRETRAMIGIREKADCLLVLAEFFEAAGHLYHRDAFSLANLF